MYAHDNIEFKTRKLLVEVRSTKFCNGTKWKGNLGVPLGCDFYTVHLNEKFIIIKDTAINSIFKLTRPKKLQI